MYVVNWSMVGYGAVPNLNSHPIRVSSRYHQWRGYKPHKRERQSPFPSRLNRGGSKARKSKKRVGADKKLRK